MDYLVHQISSLHVYSYTLKLDYIDNFFFISTFFQSPLLCTTNNFKNEKNLSSEIQAIDIKSQCLTKNRLSILIYVIILYLPFPF